MQSVLVGLWKTQNSTWSVSLCSKISKLPDSVSMVKIIEACRLLRKSNKFWMSVRPASKMQIKSFLESYWKYFLCWSDRQKVPDNESKNLISSSTTLIWAPTTRNPFSPDTYTSIITLSFLMKILKFYISVIRLIFSTCLNSCK